MLKRMLIIVMFMVAEGGFPAGDAAAQPVLADHRLMVAEHTAIRDISFLLGRPFHPVAITSTDVPDVLIAGKEGLFAAQVNVEHVTLPIHARWEFSDGTTLRGLVVRRTFTQPGRYTVHFHVANNGSEASDTFEVEVRHEAGGEGEVPERSETS